MNDTSNPEQSAATPLPGQRLRLEREACGLTVQDVARRLRLAPRVIQSLEADDYDALPSMTYVNGYLRAYARLLDLPEQTLAPPPNVTVASEPRRREFPVLPVTILVALTMLAAAVFWRIQSADELLPTRQDAEETGLAADTLPAGNRMVMPSPTERNENLAREGSIFGTTIGREDGPASDPPATTPPPGSASVSPATDQPAAQAVLSEPATAATPSGQGSAEEPSAQTHLVIRYASESWSEVRDNSGRRLVHGTMQPGRVLELTGEAPFSFVLGNASGVQVEINGERFDHRPFQRQGVARFSAGNSPSE